LVCARPISEGKRDIAPFWELYDAVSVETHDMNDKKTMPHELVLEADALRSLRLAGTSAVSATTYTRMFPGLRWKPTRPTEDVEEGLTELGQAMRDTEEPIETVGQSDLPTAGYTYWGQFIDHDLTLDLTPLELVPATVEQIPNFRTPVLDLDHVYGGGPNISPFLYERGFRRAERFLIGKTKIPNELPNDLPRNEQGTAIVPDSRQDQNLIIAQLHVAFLKLHNLVISRRAEMDASPHYRPAGATDFATAQRVVRWHYQYAICHDFLPKLLDDVVVEKELPSLETEARAFVGRTVGIPVEFSAAAFRFGHSMVRDIYKSINSLQENVTLATLLEKTGAYGGAAPRLPAEWVIEWDRFFEILPNTAHLSSIRKIDTQIAHSLHELNEPTIKQFSVLPRGAIPQPRLPVRTLLRGYWLGLPSGEDVAATVLSNKPSARRMNADQIVDGPHKHILTNPRYGFLGQTPLWYYILKEAEILHKGRRLGPVGSYIVAVVLLRAIAGAEDTYFSAPNWQPTLDGGAVVSMARILQFAN
jgi:Animal haem peroxidase